MPDLAAVVATFAETTIGHTPWDAHDQCFNESHRFQCYLEAAGVNGEKISGFKFERFMGHDVVVQGHTAVVVGDLVYDWTARQFDPDAPVPKITTRAEFRAEWPPLFSERTT